MTYMFTQQCQYCGLPIEYDGMMDKWYDNMDGNIVCANVYPEYRAQFDYMPDHKLAQ